MPLYRNNTAGHLSSVQHLEIELSVDQGYRDIPDRWRTRSRSERYTLFRTEISPLAAP